MRFSEVVMEHFQSPLNRGHMESPDRVGVFGVPGRGPYFLMELRLEGERVTAARFDCHGCGATVASGSVLTELIIGKTLGDCQKVTVPCLIRALEGLPPDKTHCAHEAISALQMALDLP